MGNYNNDLIFIYVKAEFLIYWCIYDSFDVPSHAPAAKWTSLLCLIGHMVWDRLQNSIQGKWKYCQASPNEKQHACHSSPSVHFSASYIRLLLLSVRKLIHMWIVQNIFVHQAIIIITNTCMHPKALITDFGRIIKEPVRKRILVQDQKSITVAVGNWSCDWKYYPL